MTSKDLQPESPNANFESEVSEAVLQAEAERKNANRGLTVQTQWSSWTRSSS